MSYNPLGIPGLPGDAFWKGGAVADARRTAIRAVILSVAVLVIPLRLWSIIESPPLEIYRLYPWWLQVVTVAVFGGQALVAVRRRESALLTALAVGVSGATAAVQGAASFPSGSWLWWVCMAAVQGYTYLQIKQAEREAL